MSAANHSPSLPDASEPTKEKRNCFRWLQVSFWITALLLGLAHAWADRHYLENADAMSYLDIADAYLRADWANAINSYWGPLYSWLTALAFLVVKPSPYWKFAVLHLVNFAIFLFTFGCFDFLIHELIRLHRRRSDDLRQEGFIKLQGWVWLALGYPLCLWSQLYLIKVREESPDMLVAASVFLASAIVLRIQRQPGKWLPFVLLGLALGVGYLSKAVMLPVSLIFLMVTLFLTRSFSKAAPRVLVAVIAFLVIAGPFIFAISRSKGRFTFGESGRLNYLWAINGVRGHWQGESHGSPVHPTRKVFDEPAIYEFGEPIGGTYPPWYDATYWFEGSVARFDLRGQIRALANGVAVYYELFSWGVHFGLLVVLLTLYFMGRRRWLLLNDLGEYWPVIVPALAGMGIYSMINVQGRYVAPFVVLLWLALFSAIRLPDSRESQRLIVITALTWMTITFLTIVASSSRELGATASYLTRGEDRAVHEQWQVAENLRQVGVMTPDRVAVIGNSARSFWAHLLGVRIVSEITEGRVNDFWAADSSVKNRVFETFARTGAKVIVTEGPPTGSDLTGWSRIGNTTHYYYALER